MEILVSGFLLGLMGSFHCVGMCGPIALSLPLRGENYLQKVTGGILYNLGRTITYAIMGAVFGLIGQGFQLVGLQKWISIAMGVLMIVSILVPSLFKKINSGNDFFLTVYVRKGIQRLFTVRSYIGLLFIGLLNGLLPCGLVYMAIAGAIGTSDFYYGIAFMVLFGLGTLPMLLIVSVLGNLISLSVRNIINKVIPFVVVLVGVIFIMRGLTLGIPYLSPPKDKLTPGIKLDTLVIETDSVKVNRSCCGSN